MVRVRDWTSPLCTFVWVIERLHVPRSCARAIEWPFRLFALPLTLDLLMSLVPPAALPAVPSVDEVVPVGLVEVPPVPSVVADVPPTAALPEVPPVAAEPLAPTDAPPLPTEVALWAIAAVETAALRAPASKASLKFVRMKRSYFFRPGLT